MSKQRKGPYAYNRPPMVTEALQEQLVSPLLKLNFESRPGILIEREWLQQSACIGDIDYAIARNNQIVTDGIKQRTVCGINWLQ